MAEDPLLGHVMTAPREEEVEEPQEAEEQEESLSAEEDDEEEEEVELSAEDLQRQLAESQRQIQGLVGNLASLRQERATNKQQIEALTQMIDSRLPKTEEAEPDPEEDPAAFVSHQIGNLGKKIEQVQEKLTATEEQQQRQQLAAAVTTRIREDAGASPERKTQFEQQVTELAGHFGQQIMAQGHTEEQAAAMIQQYVVDAGAAVYSQGSSFVDYVAQLYSQTFQGSAPAPQVPLATQSNGTEDVARGVRKGTSASASAGRRSTPKWLHDKLDEWNRLDVATQRLIAGNTALFRELKETGRLSMAKVEAAKNNRRRR